MADDLFQLEGVKFDNGNDILLRELKVATEELQETFRRSIERSVEVRSHSAGRASRREDDAELASINAQSARINALLVQAGSKCKFGRPQSVIEHITAPFGNYFKCGHANPVHYWDANGNKLTQRP